MFSQEYISKGVEKSGCKGMWPQGPAANLFSEMFASLAKRQLDH